MVESNIKIGIVSNTNLERKEEFRKILASPFIDYFEITSKELNGNSDEFILPPTSMVNTDTGMKDVTALIDRVANNVSWSNFALGLTEFTIDVVKYRGYFSENFAGWEKDLMDLNLAIQELTVDGEEITIYLKGLETIISSIPYTKQFLKQCNEKIKEYNDENDVIVTFKPAMVIRGNGVASGNGENDSKVTPRIIAEAGRIYLSPTKIGKDFTSREPSVRDWANVIRNAERLSKEPITIFYEDDISSISSIANLIQIFKPELRSQIKALNLSGSIDKW